MDIAKRLLSLNGKPLSVSLVNGEFTVCYDKCDVKEDIFLKAAFGKGDTFYTACEDYLNKITGKTLVFYGGKEREEIRVI